MTNYTVDYENNAFSWSPNYPLGSAPKLFHDKVGMTDKVVQYYIRNLSGKIFTLLDASITNDRQLKAMKDSIRNYIADTYGDIDNLCWGTQTQDYCNEVASKMTDEEIKELEKNSVSIEEAVGV